MRHLLHSLSMVATLTATLGVTGHAFALKPGCSAPPCGQGGGNQPPGGETAPNNLSYPVIFSDNARPPDWDTSVTSDPFTWLFATFPSPIPNTDACLQESGVPVGTEVPANLLCYYGRPTTTQSDGSLMFIGDEEMDKKVWWLQQRAANRWQAFNPTAADAGNPLVVVSAVDVGDLLESSMVIKAKQVRTEFVMYQDAAEPGSPFARYLPGGDDCLDPTSDPTRCFVQHTMSGAVPFTQRSIFETAGSDYGPGTGDQPGTGTLPASAKEVIGEDGTTFFVDATVYSRCARLLIQKVAAPNQALTWIYGPDPTDPNKTVGSWGPRTLANAPPIDIRAWDDGYSAEINAGGSLLYGYNWNTKNFAEGPGWYRLTFVLEGQTCMNAGVTPNTVFGDESQVVNRGETHPAEMLSMTELAALGATQGEGGAVYVEVQLGSSGGGGRGGGGPGGGGPGGGGSP
ncbi:MAG: hypothetical protein R3B70_08565 [Polyangiaceae bacterium]